MMAVLATLADDAWLSEIPYNSVGRLAKSLLRR
jgi:hypothetical protein